MAAHARFVLSASLSLVAMSLWGGGCSSSNNTTNTDAATNSAKMDTAPGTPSDLALGTAYDSSPLADGPVSLDGPSLVADALLTIDVAGKDVGIGTSTDLPTTVFYDSSTGPETPGPDKPASSDLASDKNADLVSLSDAPITINLDAQTSSDLASGGADSATGPEVASGPDVPTCGGLSQACCGGSTCDSNLVCLNGTSCSCAKALYGRYLLRVDGALLYETDPTSTAQTPVLDGNTGLPLVGMTGVQEGAYHGCAVQGSSQTAWCWRTGASGNAYGQLGNGTTDSLTTSFQATQVLTAANTPLANVVAVADTEVPYVGTGDSSCAVTGEGKVYCWGTLSYLTNGGTALTSAYAVPITTDGATPLAGALKVGLYASGAYACAILQGASSKEVWCWGDNANGYLGLGDKTTRRYPTKVLGFTSPTKVLTDDYYGTTCVLDGSNVRCFGYNGQGETGNGTTTTPVLSPALVTLMGGTTALDNVVDLHCGDDSSYANFCALTTTNTLLCWGYGYQSYPADFGVTSVAALGGTGADIRYLTSDGMYHIGTASNHVGTTRVPSCGPLH